MAKKLITEETENNVDTKKILKDLTQELNTKKAEILESIDIKIDTQIEAKINKRMREEEKRLVRGKNGKIIRRDIFIIILLALTGYFGYCLYKIDYFNLLPKKTVETPPTKAPDNTVEPIQDIKPVEEKNDSEELIKEYSYLIDNLQIEDEEIFDIFSKKINVEDISNTLKTKIAYKNISEAEKETKNNMITFSKEILDEKARQIFGNRTTLEYDDFTYNKTDFMLYQDLYIGYDKEADKIGLLYQILNAKEEDDILTLECIIGKNIDNKLLNLNDKVIAKNFRDDKILDYEDDLPHYEIKFIKENDNYILEEINNI